MLSSARCVALWHCPGVNFTFNNCDHGHFKGIWCLTTIKSKKYKKYHVCSKLAYVKAPSILRIKKNKKNVLIFSSQTSDTAAMAAPGVCTSIMTARNKKNGFGTTSNPERFLNQDFQQIRQLCRNRNVRYIDDTFPPNKWSIGSGVLSPERLHRVVWKRPYVSVFVARSQRRDLTSLLSLLVQRTCFSF